MVQTNHLNPGMTLSVDDHLYRVESAVKVTPPKGQPFIKTKLRDLHSNKVVEQNFKLNQVVKDVTMTERRLEYLYLEGKDYLFLDIGKLEQSLVPASVVGTKVKYLKEGVDVKASFFGDTVFSIELPQFLEIMVVKIDSKENGRGDRKGSKIAALETGAKIEVPPFIEVGDIVKVDTNSDEYIQRV